MRAVHAMPHQPSIRVGWPDITRKSAAQYEYLHNTHLFRLGCTPTSGNMPDDIIEARLATLLKKAAHYSENQNPILWMWRVRLKYFSTSLPSNLIRAPFRPDGNDSQCMEPGLRILFSYGGSACPLCGQIYNETTNWYSQVPRYPNGVRTDVSKPGSWDRVFTPCSEGCISISFNGDPVTNPDRWKTLQARLLYATRTSDATNRTKPPAGATSQPGPPSAPTC